MKKEKIMEYKIDKIKREITQISKYKLNRFGQERGIESC